MKIKLIAVAISGLLVAGAVNAAEIYNKDGNKLDLYGKVVGLHYFSQDNSKEGDKTYARLGVKGETQIASQLSGYGHWEHEFKANGPESSGSHKDKTRLAFAGLNIDEFGSLDYGRNFGVAYNIGSWTDMLPEFGADTWIQTDVFMTKRSTGLATWRNNDFFGLVEGLNFAVQYQAKNDSNERFPTETNGDGFGISSSYEYQGFAIGAAYTKSDRTKAQEEYALFDPENAKGKSAELWVAGLKYDANNLYLAVTYAESLNMTVYGKWLNIANKTQNIEMVAQYQFDFGLRPSIAYLKSKGMDFVNWYDEDLVEYIDVGTSYYFNKNMSSYIDYKINLLEDNEFTRATGISTDNIVAVGLVYQF